MARHVYTDATRASSLDDVTDLVKRARSADVFLATFKLDFFAPFNKIDYKSTVEKNAGRSFYLVFVQSYR